MTQEDFLQLISAVADTTGHSETTIYDYLWSILRHPIAPASINRLITGSQEAISGTEFNYDYVDRLHQLLNERGLCPEYTICERNA